jgi:hypothetical protein
MGLLLILLSFIFFAGVSMTVNEGLWSNTISVFVIIVAALIAIPWGYFVGVIVVVAAQPSEENTWAFVFASVWGMFALAAVILRLITDRLSRVRMKFIPQLDKIGGVLMGLVVATMFSSFAALTLVLLPIPAGVWKIEDASAKQQKRLTRTAAPMYTALLKFYGGEFASLVDADE